MPCADLKDLLLRDQRVRADALEENVADYQGTIGQFRELVFSLQGCVVSIPESMSVCADPSAPCRDLDQLREHQATQQSESQSLTSQSQAMLNLNLKLQSSMLKGQVKTIELELRKLDAQQATEQLSIMKVRPSPSSRPSEILTTFFLYSPTSFLPFLRTTAMPSTRSSSSKDLRTRPTSSAWSSSRTTTSPTALTLSFQKPSLASARYTGLGCDLGRRLLTIPPSPQTRAKLGRYSALNRRFAAQLKRCSAEVFLKMGRVYREVSGTEKRIDSFIDALRKEELREVECGREVDGYVALFTNSGPDG